MRIFAIPKSPIVDESGRLRPEWLAWFNNIAGAGDAVIASELPTLIAVLASQPIAVSVNPDPAQGFYAEVQAAVSAHQDFEALKVPIAVSNDHALNGLPEPVSTALNQRFMELELWSLNHGY